LKALFAPQLLLERRWRAGASQDRGAARAVHSPTAQWLGEGGTVKEIAESDELVKAMVALVQRMAHHFANPSTPYAALPWPEYGPYFNDYEHLRATYQLSRPWETRSERDVRCPVSSPAASSGGDGTAFLLGRGQCRHRQDQGAHRRVTRLLCRHAPERVLCLTFTKAAAAEMRNRLASQLGRWAMASDATSIATSRR